MKRHFPTLLKIQRPYRIAAYILAGFVVFGFLQLWREEYVKAHEYIDFSIHSIDTKRSGEMRSANYQLDTQEISPAVK